MGIGIVHTGYGPVQGVALEGKYEGITCFRGIPFAAPPVGENRWRPPREPESWKEVRHCDIFAKMAPQVLEPQETFIPYGLDFYYEGYPEQSEDCLYLNVCTGAQNAQEKRPVYMWFHGGGLSTGFTYEVEFNPEELARKGIVVVMVAQRLNVLGYLALPQLSEEQGCVSGNYGLMDQLMALKWVKENIASFGGDPDCITIGGQSGGTTKTCAMAALPCTQGQIKRVINESGLKYKHVVNTPEQMYEKSRRYLMKLGIDPDASPEALRKIPADQLVDGSADMPAEMVCDGNLIPDTHLERLFEKYVGRVDFLCGSNFGEGHPLASPNESVDTWNGFYHNYRVMLGDLYDQYRFESIYPPAAPSPRLLALRLSCLGITQADRRGMGRNLMLARLFGKKRAENGSKTYVYFFRHVLPGRPEDKGTPRDTDRLLAYHSSELWYTFASLRPGVPPVRPWRDSDYRVADMVSSWWANFIKTGDPNGENLPHWPGAHENYGWIEIEEKPVAHSGAESPEEQLLMAYVKRSFGV